MPNLSKNDQRDAISTTEARRRKEVALARLRELEVAEKERQVLPVETVTTTWVKIASMIKAAVLRLPDELAPQVVAVTDVREARAVLATECEAILKGLHDDIDYTAR